MFDTVISARALMGVSLGFHIVFAALGIGLPLLLFIAEGLWLRTGDAHYREMARRWSRVAAVLFAVGAVSGTILSFEFGLLWPTWMEFSGAIIGLPFALEGFAFFTEAIFLGLYLYGWDRLSPRAHWLCTVPMVVSSALSAFFVISANAWMNQPEGFEVVAGKAVNVDPLAAMFNDAMPYQVVHGTLPSYSVTGFAVAAVYAFAMLRGDRSPYNRKALSIALAVAAVAAPLQIVSGDLSARFLAHQQPEKFAAMEAQFETERGAPLRIGGVPDPEDRTVRWAIEIPKLASFLAFEDVDAEIRGLNSFPQDAIPDVRIVHYSFQTMVGIGFLMLFVSVWFWGAAWWKRRIDPGRPLLWALLATGPLGFLALEAGWFVTEFGRQPWIIYRMMRVEEAATPREGIGIVFLVFTLVYVALAIGLGLILLRENGRAARMAGLGEAHGVA
ncbi:MAG TPA: cytochrome ubiquinol oxidase subunit I [Dehalococcoidia bacterium]|nr:cytochrome ubiquinol oxidase subunit I [Dehalococcoidia bacterium]